MRISSEFKKILIAGFTIGFILQHAVIAYGNSVSDFEHPETIFTPGPGRKSIEFRSPMDGPMVNNGVAIRNFTPEIYDPYDDAAPRNIWPRAMVIFGLSCVLIAVILNSRDYHDDNDRE